MEKRLLTPLLLTLFAFFFFPAFLPALRLHIFAPLIALIMNRKTFGSALMATLLCGLFMDLSTYETSLGFYSLNYLLTLIVIYPLRRNFSEERPLSFSLHTYLISAISTAFHLGALLLVRPRFPLGLNGFISETLITPFSDALYGALWFSLPMALFALFQTKKRSLRYD